MGEGYGFFYILYVYGEKQNYFYKEHGQVPFGKLMSNATSYASACMEMFSACERPKTLLESET